MATESGGLSKEEFILVQEQLLQLRNENYELREEIRKKNQVQQQQSSPKSEALQFASKLINRASSSKKDEKDGEIEALRRKLETQEQEFRLQQSTLFEELKTLSNQNETLKNQMASYTDHPLEKEVGRPVINVTELEDEIRTLKEEKTMLCDETVPALNERISHLKEQVENNETLNIQLEDRLLALKSENEELKKQKGSFQSEFDKKEEILKNLRVENSEIVSNSDSRVEELNSKITRMEEEKNNNAVERLQFQQELSEQSSQLESLRAENLKLSEKVKKLQENSVAVEDIQAEHGKKTGELKNTISELTTQLEALKSENHSLSAEIQKSSEESAKNQEKQLEDRILLVETRYQLEVDDQKKRFDAEQDQLRLRITSLEEKLRASDEEKKLAVKKQTALVKELQKTLKEERKRADSYERKSEERAGWHVVPPENDGHSHQTFDGNESVSSLSAIESENVELITRLASLQKIHSENADTILQLESENSRLRREVTEKGELIENLIREKPLGPAFQAQQNSALTPKLEVSFRKLLNTLSQDSSTSDVREMNKKLQRMLEETLSKNIILQRDLQTIMERTGL
ncbi:unnamed protein product [Caenorhabditis sp. 36 PRJEB53466]|nr:unnamed protein product [Caenorhabditis sp. 36 PRJEB53466]